MDESLVLTVKHQRMGIREARGAPCNPESLARGKMSACDRMWLCQGKGKDDRERSLKKKKDKTDI